MMPSETRSCRYSGVNYPRLIALDHDDTKTDVVDFQLRLVAESVGGPATAGFIDPSTTSVDTIGSRGGTRGIFDIGLWIVTIEVLAPLPNVSMHVVESPRVGFQGPYWMGFSLRIGLEPSVVAERLLGVTKGVG